MLHHWVKHILVATMLLMLGTTVSAQNITEIAQSDPLIISGAIGTRNTYSYSSDGMGASSPLNSTIYANLNISIYGFNMPFSLIYSNDNLSFSYPQLSFNLTPVYKNWTGHFGLSTMSMSSYVMNMSFNGVGLEYKSNRMRAGIFYGRLRNAINDDPSDPYARSPQYKRMGWGMKVGYGTNKNYVDLYMLRAYDCLNSLDEAWQSQIRPQENIVVGLKGCVTPFNWMSFTVNAAASVFSKDTEAPQIPTTTDFDKIFDTRYSTLMRFAGDASLNFMFRGFNASISYRLVQPDYNSLGTYYMANNYHSVAITANTILFNKLSLSATFSGQADNLTKQQAYTTCGYVYGAYAGMRLGNHFNITAGYNGYLQNQRNGSCIINDTIRVNRLMSSISITPSFNYETEVLGHSANISLNYTSNKDLNKFSNKESDVQTSALGAFYLLDVKPWKTDISLSASLQQSKGYGTTYMSDVASVCISRSFLKDENLHLSLTGSLCYNEVKRQSKSLSLGFDISAGYTLKKVHVFSAGAGFNKFGDVNITKTKSNLDTTNITVNFSYVYTFTLVAIKSKANKNKEAGQQL